MNLSRKVRVHGLPAHRRARCPSAQLGVPSRKAAGISTATETSGYAAELHIWELMPATDLWLYDIKGMNPVKHKEHPASTTPRFTAT